MKKRGRRHQENLDLVDREKLYGPVEAIELVEKAANAKFDETVELSVKLNVDPKHADQLVRGAVILPHGTGKTKKVLAFVKGDKVKEAEAAGADYVGGEELAEKIQKENWLDFDVVVATPDMMSVVGKLGRILGPKGLMPNPKSGTITFEIEKAIKDIKAGKVEYRVDKSSVIHVPIGKVSFGTKKLRENFRTIMDAIINARPASVKGRYIINIVLASTMGPGVKVNSQRVVDALVDEEE